MYKLAKQTTLMAIFAAFALAQTPQSTQRNTQNSSNSSAASMAAGGGQSFRGVLMDASCAAIQSRATQATSVGSTQSADAERNRIDASPTTATPRSSAQNQSTAIGGSASSTGSSQTNNTNSGGTAATRNTTADTTGANNSHEGQATAHAGTVPPTTARSTATAAGTTAAIGSAPVTTYNGAATTAANADASATGDRNRTDDATGAGSQWTTVREKYSQCMVTPTTTSFALMSNGRLYLVDDSAGMLRQRMSANPATGAASDFRTVTVMGTPQGDRISVTSLQ